MKRFFILLLLGLSCQLSGYAQLDILKISGIITDSLTGEPIPSASVHVCDTPAFVHSDQRGAFSMTLQEGMMKLQFSAVGYITLNVEVNMIHDLELNIMLEPHVIDDSSHFKRWEIDWKAFNCYGFSNMYNGAMTMFGLERRYDIWRTPLEVGLGFSYALPLNLDLQESYRYWTVYASVDCNLRRLGFKIAKNWLVPYIGIAAGGGQSYHADVRSIANYSLRAGFNVRSFRIFFEQHFNSDKARGSYWGLTYYL